MLGRSPYLPGAEAIGPVVWTPAGSAGNHTELWWANNDGADSITVTHEDATTPGVAISVNESTEAQFKTNQETTWVAMMVTLR